MTKLKAFVYSGLGAGLGLAVAGLLLFAGAKLLGQSLFWLKNGYWQPYSILNLLRDLDIRIPTTPDLLGVQKIIDDVVSWPAAVGLVAVAGLCGVIASFFIGLNEEYDREIRGRAEAASAAKRAREALEQRRAEAEITRKDFDFAEPIEELRSRKGPFA
jgi:hypothetical protein